MKILRSPIVAVLGHVDHGKTSLLDAIRKTNVVKKEAGGITQHIGAYQVEIPQESKSRESEADDLAESRKITFIDTPGHEAFSQMRGRGARVADLVLLVVAADDGVKPQTRESLVHIKQANIPFVVVVTKIDLPTANVPQVKKELENESLSLEGRGGDTVVLEVSAKTGQGLDHILEMILLMAEIHEVSGSSSSPLEAVVIESGLDRKKGPMATVIVRDGQIIVGDKISAGQTQGKVKALLDEFGQNIQAVLPGQPALILGFDKTPQIGEKVSLTEGEKSVPAQEISPANNAIEGKLSLIIKTDTAGRLEALLTSLPKEVGILLAGVGEITASDVMLAGSFKGEILAFGVNVPVEVEKLAVEEKVTLNKFSIIYEALDWVNKKLTESGKIEEEKLLGQGEVIAQFPYGEKGKIAGVKVLEGRIAKPDLLTLTRKGEAVGKSKIASLKQQGQNVDSVTKGQECGILFSSGKLDFQIGDGIIVNKS